MQGTMKGAGWDERFRTYPRYVPRARLVRAREHCKDFPVSREDMEKAKEECLENREWIVFCPEVADRDLLKDDVRWGKGGSVVPPCPHCKANNKVRPHASKRNNIEADKVTVIDDYESESMAALPAPHSPC